MFLPPSSPTPHLRFLKQMCREKNYLQGMATDKNIKIYMQNYNEFSGHCKPLLIIAFRMVNCIINYEVLSLKKQLWIDDCLLVSREAI